MYVPEVPSLTGVFDFWFKVGATENASTENASTNLPKWAMANSSFVDK